MFVILFKQKQRLSLATSRYIDNNRYNILYILITNISYAYSNSVAKSLKHFINLRKRKRKSEGVGVGVGVLLGAGVTRGGS